MTLGLAIALSVMGHLEREKMDEPTFEHTIDGYGLERTCFACPEQYDVWKDGRVVGYMRLRHGWFYTAFDAGEEPIYEAEPESDGMFEAGERDGFLRAGIEALDKALRK